jgi:hypothetical protein
MQTPSRFLRTLVESKSGNLAFAGALALVDGVMSQVLVEHPGPARTAWLLASLAGIFIVYRWVAMDARELKFRRSGGLRLGIVMLPLIAVPYYFFRTRRFVGGLQHTLAFVGLFFAWSIISYAAAWGTYGVQAATQTDAVPPDDAYLE